VYLDFRRPSGPLGLVGRRKIRMIEVAENRTMEFQLQDHLTSSYDGPFSGVLLAKGV